MDASAPATALPGLAPGVLARRPAILAPGGLAVLLVVDSLDGGGAERYVVDLALALRARGSEVRVACASAGVLAAPLRAAGIPVDVVLGVPVKRRLSFAFAAALRRLIRRQRPDVVHANVYASASAAALALAGSAVPLVLTEHTEAPWRGRRARWASRVAYRRAARVVCVSTAIDRLLRERFGVPAERVIPIPNAVSVPTRGARPPLPAGCVEGPLIGRVCRLAPEKGVDVFLRAAARLAERRPEARFLVVGDGPCRHELEALARRLGVGERVRFLGYRSDARAIIAHLDVLAVTSISDGAPLVVLEANEVGVPVVASAVGGLPDLVADGRDGLLVPPGDDHALAAALDGLLADPGRARELGATGRERARRWSHGAMVDAVEAVYAGCLGRPVAVWG